jgi:hypothetical protein
MDDAKDPASAAVHATKNTANDIIDTTKTLEKKLQQKLTYLYHELPTWQQDNPSIHTGYRPASNSYAKSLQSLSYLHNESVNIYTHLLGCLLFLLLSISIFRTIALSYSASTNEDVYVFACFFAGAIACLGMSATYHTISNHSHKVAKFGNQLDYAGIVGLIWGSFVPVVYYAFGGDEHLRTRYWAMVRVYVSWMVGVVTDNLTDYDAGRMYGCDVDASFVSDAGSSTVQSVDVRPHGPVCCGAGHARYAFVWHRAYAKCRWSQLRRCAGRALHPRSCYLRCAHT